MSLPQLNVPQYQVKLPSTGETLNMRPYLVKEEKVLMIALESNDAEQIQNAVRNIIFSCYDIQGLDKLTVFDIEYLFLQLRAKSVGEKMELQVKCQATEECDGLTPIVVDINDIDIINSDLDRTIMLDEELGVGVQMRFPSMDIVNSIDIEKLNSVEGVMNLIIQCIDSIFDQDNVYNADDSSTEELENFVDGLNGDQFRKVQAFFNESPAVYYESEYTCEKCKVDQKLELRGLTSFFT